MKKFLVVAAGIAALFFVMDNSVSAESVCPGTHLSAGNQTTFTYTAPEGFLISSYCVKAGSDQQGDGPEIHTVDPPQESITFSHSSGKEISHFSVTLVPETNTTTTLPQCPDPPCVPGTVIITTTTTEAITSTSTSIPQQTSTTDQTTTTDLSTSTTIILSTSTTETSTSLSVETTTTLPETFEFGAAATVCRAEVPTIVIEFQNRFPSLAGQTGTLTMSDINGNVVSSQPLVYQPGTTVELLYPGTAVNPDGSIDDVPGWILQDNGLWVRDPSDEFLREGINLTYTVNPTASAFITYPPESSACANPDNPTPPPGTLPPTK